MKRVLLYGLFLVLLGFPLGADGFSWNIESRDADWNAEFLAGMERLMASDHIPDSVFRLLKTELDETEWAADPEELAEFAVDMARKIDMDLRRGTAPAAAGFTIRRSLVQHFGSVESGDASTETGSRGKYGNSSASSGFQNRNKTVLKYSVLSRPDRATNERKQKLIDEGFLAPGSEAGAGDGNTGNSSDGSGAAGDSGNNGSGSEDALQNGSGSGIDSQTGSSDSGIPGSS